MSERIIFRPGEPLLPTIGPDFRYSLLATKIAWRRNVPLRAKKQNNFLSNGCRSIAASCVKIAP
jgi:hypothetical protein